MAHEQQTQPKPIINLDELEAHRTQDHGDRYQATLATVSARVGAQRLAYNVTTVAPGKRAFPLHNHQVNEELFLILEGAGTLRLGVVARLEPGQRLHDAPFAGFYDESRRLDYWDGE